MNLPDVWVTIWSQMSGGILFVAFIGGAIALIEDLDRASHTNKLKMAQVGLIQLETC